ncbi:MAG TPA: TonB-dependent receptor plug domain-containing protein [Nitrospiraceae bacterium]|nr:TonB-dependent receptor plug domain-containing protein [Nitrospiraceae bacterium]
MVLLMTPILLSTPATAQEARPTGEPSSGLVEFTIPAQSLDAALKDFAEATDLLLSFESDLATGFSSSGVAGRYTQTEALGILLAGTGLRYRFVNEKTVTLEKAPAVSRSLPATRDGVRPNGTEAKEPMQPTPVKLQEIIVKEVREREDPKTYVAEEARTATRTDTPVRDIPQSIQVITRKVIEEQRTFRLQDALQSVSGIIATDSAASLYDNLIIRGFAATDRTYFRNGLFDPFAQFTASDTYNIRRLEVLKGPASVLYGQGDPGGVINLVTFKPPPECRLHGQCHLGQFQFLSI